MFSIQYLSFAWREKKLICISEEVLIKKSDQNLYRKPLSPHSHIWFGVHVCFSQWPVLVAWYLVSIFLLTVLGQYSKACLPPSPPTLDIQADKCKNLPGLPFFLYSWALDPPSLGCSIVFWALWYLGVPSFIALYPCSLGWKPLEIWRVGWENIPGTGQPVLPQQFPP